MVGSPSSETLGATAGIYLVREPGEHPQSAGGDRATIASAEVPHGRQPLGIATSDKRIATPRTTPRAMARPRQSDPVSGTTALGSRRRGQPLTVRAQSTFPVAGCDERDSSFGPLDAWSPRGANPG